MNHRRFFNLARVLGPRRVNDQWSLAARAVAVGLVLSCAPSKPTASPATDDAGAGTAADAADVPDASDGDAATSPWQPAPHPAAPQVGFHKGPVLASPKLVVITYPGDPWASDLEALADSIGASPYWKAVTGEYGVGASVAGPPIRLTEAPPSTIDDANIRAWIAAKLGDASHPWGAPDSSAVLTIFYPAATVTTLNGATSCVDFSGYHDSVTVNGMHLAYAVIPRCTAIPVPFPPSAPAEDLVTGSAAHEWIEAATDPETGDDTAYAIPGLADVSWLALAGTELADMCAVMPNAFFPLVDVAGHYVQRSWSNAAAAAGHDPCVPHLSSGAYFNAVPMLGDEIPVSVSGESFTSRGVAVALGQSKTIEVDLFSDSPTSGPWTVEALDYTALFQQPPELKLSLDAASGANGDKLALTITPLVKDTFWGAAPFVLVSTLGDQKNLWVGFAGPPQ